MALRQALSKSLLANFERDLSQMMARELKDVGPMLDATMAPRCYGYAAAGRSAAGGFKASPFLKSPTTRVVKVNFPLKQHGLFQ